MSTIYIMLNIAYSKVLAFMDNTLAILFRLGSESGLRDFQTLGSKLYVRAQKSIVTNKRIITEQWMTIIYVIKLKTKTFQLAVLKTHKQWNKLQIRVGKLFGRAEQIIIY